MTFDLIGGVTPALDKLLQDWGEATTLGVDGHAEHGAGSCWSTARPASRSTRWRMRRAMPWPTREAQFGQHEQRIQLFTLVVLLLQVLSGTLAIAAMFFAFRSSAREADGRSAALKSADTSREQVARLFEMADVLQSATDYGDANQVLKATAADLAAGLWRARSMCSTIRATGWCCRRAGAARRARRSTRPSRPTSAGR